MPYYRMFVDESGNHAYGKALKRTFNLKLGDIEQSTTYYKYPDLEDENQRYLALIGVIVNLDTYSNSIDPAFRNLKEKCFRSHVSDSNSPIIMHRKEIINRTGPFSALLNPAVEKQYNADLLKFFNLYDYKLILVIIDKLQHIETYDTRAYHPYHYCLTAMLERYCGLLNMWGGQGDVLAECRGRKDDKPLKAAYKTTLRNGTNYRDPNFFNEALANKLIVEPKSNDVTGLQLADLLVHPLKKECLITQNISCSTQTPFALELCSVVNNKYNRHYYNGRIKGYGIVCL